MDVFRNRRALNEDCDTDGHKQTGEAEQHLSQGKAGKQPCCQQRGEHRSKAPREIEEGQRGAAMFGIALASQNIRRCNDPA